MDTLKNFSQELSGREIANPSIRLNRTNPDKQSPPTASTLMSSTSNRTSNDGPPRCAFCKQAHLSSNCTTVVAVDARWSALKR